jgi:hypothetical protein
MGFLFLTLEIMGFLLHVLFHKLSTFT